MSTLTVSSDYTVEADQTLSLTDTSGNAIIRFDPSGTDASFYNYGTVSLVEMSTTADGVASTGGAGFYQHSIFWNEAGATFDLMAPADGARAVGYVGGESPLFHNSGLFTVEAPNNGAAFGVDDSTVLTTITNDGTVRVAAGDIAVGLYPMNGGTVVNTGDIEVDAGNAATGIEFGDTISKLTNSGTITATATTDSGVSYGVAIYGVSFAGSGQHQDVITNSGTIQGDYSVYVPGSTVSHGDGTVEIDNTGTMIGNILLTRNDDTIVNKFIIEGQVDMGLGNDHYDGTQSLGVSQVDGGRGDDVLAGGEGIDILYGDAGRDGANDGNDILTGNGGNDLLSGEGGDDTMDGGTGVDWALYLTAKGAVTVDLTHSGAQNTGGAGTDTLISIENIAGSAFNDVLTGDSGNNVIDGGSAGDDTLDGGGGINTASYGYSATGVTVSLAISGPQATGSGTDTLKNFANLIGSDFNDTLIGNSGNNALYGGSGNDLLVGGGGNDTFVGNDGIDTVDFSSAARGVSIDLSIQTAQNIGGAHDTFIEISNLVGSAFSDRLTGDDDANLFDISLGGNDSVAGQGGDDVVVAAGAFTATDRIDGGEGADRLQLDGDYAHGVNLRATTLSSVEEIDVAAGHSYKLTFDDANVAAGESLKIDGSQLGVGDTLSLNAGRETDGAYLMIGGAGNDHFTGGAGNDVISGGDGNNSYDLSAGGNDKVTGGAGTDVFSFGSAFTSKDIVNGGAGADTIVLDGDYSTGLTLGAGTLFGVEAISLNAAHSYKLVFNDSNVLPAQSLSVGGMSEKSTNTVYLDGSHENDGHLSFSGGGGKDTLIGGGSSDTLWGGGGADLLTGGGGADTFVFAAVGDSVSTGYDHITDFDATTDFLSIHSRVKAVETPVSGSLSAASFDSDLANAIGTHLHGHQSLLFTANAGDLSGHTFLVVDANGVQGYQAGGDMVIELTGGSNLANLSAGNFV